MISDCFMKIQAQFWHGGTSVPRNALWDVSNATCRFLCKLDAYQNPTTSSVPHFFHPLQITPPTQNTYTAQMTAHDRPLPGPVLGARRGLGEIWHTGRVRRHGQHTTKRARASAKWPRATHRRSTWSSALTLGYSSRCVPRPP